MSTSCCRSWTGPRRSTIFWPSSRSWRASRTDRADRRPAALPVARRRDGVDHRHPVGARPHTGPLGRRHDARQDAARIHRGGSATARCGGACPRARRVTAADRRAGPGGVDGVSADAPRRRRSLNAACPSRSGVLEKEVISGILITLITRPLAIPPPGGTIGLRQRTINDLREGSMVRAGRSGRSGLG